MRNPGVAEERSDSSITQRMRRSLQDTQACKKALEDRGYTVKPSGRNNNGATYQLKLPDLFEITKEVKL